MVKTPRLKIVLPAAALIAAALLAMSTRTAIASAVIADWQSAKAYTAIVSSTEANFVFELPKREQWEWRLPETRLAGLEYSWGVTVQSSPDHRYGFGFNLFNFPSMEPSRGDLRALLRAGQWGVGEVFPDHSSAVETMKIQGIASANRLVLTVNDPKTFQRLFSERPPEATFTVRLPGQPVVVRTVPVTYLYSSAAGLEHHIADGRTS
jgi:hypothetical protein